MPSARSSARVAPVITRAAALASGTPVALAAKGTVREARGLASSTYAVPSCTANCTLSGPFTSKASAIRRVWASIAATASPLRVAGGMEQAESPEWTPACSTCSITAPMRTSPAPSRTASTSTSTASSRNRSTSTGCSAAGSPAEARAPEEARAAMASARPSSS